MRVKEIYNPRVIYILCINVLSDTYPLYSKIRGKLALKVYGIIMNAEMPSLGCPGFYGVE